jgi:hypothetical protein
MIRIYRYNNQIKDWQPLVYSTIFESWVVDLNSKPLNYKKRIKWQEHN